MLVATLTRKYYFNQTRSQAEEGWEDPLSKITVSGSNQTRLQMFYTALYHTHLMPTDRTGENAEWETSEPSYDDFYTFWVSGLDS
jgi:putative alpha-1,2-mannosidase